MEGYPFDSTRWGLCPYCPDVCFVNFKHSSYSNHLAYKHGVFANGYIEPNPIYPGFYEVADNVGPRAITTTQGISIDGARYCYTCPACYKLVEAKCTYKLSDYLAHFIEHHTRRSTSVKYYNPRYHRD
ncbi:uncharacterized protein RJT20DRAFT_147658 [Scheffersomyces xylosifermentans]|uniref:uncharacterized protein n=1 Tax=Scheffersomyces xylosifermentans TaxID=1304137 RepID=UPI00315DEEAE